MRKLLIPLGLVALLATACSVSYGTRSADQASRLSQTAPSAGPMGSGAKLSVQTVVARVLPAVVNVTSDVVANGQQGRAVGTGFIVRSDGIVVTNCHVVEDASKLTVSTSAEKPTQYDGRVIGADCEHDLAVLKIDATNLPTVPLGTSSALRLGQPVVALGYALALQGGPTVTEGIVSSLDRTIQAQDPACTSCSTSRAGIPFRTYSDVVQTDAAINHGNSGGPLVNLAGQVVGINTAGDDRAQNIGFAIGIDSAKDTIAKAESDPLAPSAYLGVTTQGVTPQLALQFGLRADHGAYVVATTNGGPAAAAGIKQGDVIVGLDGKTVASADDLGNVLSGLRPGTRVTVDVVSQSGQTQSIDVTLGTRPLPTTLP